MTDEMLDNILRDGAGKQWDARVVQAFFEIRDEIRKIIHPLHDTLEAELVRMG
jgi:response regulator RpfG family c-di-GMP phosphodiesterase